MGDKIKERVQLELTDDNMQVAVQHIIQAYRKRVPDKVPELLNVLVTNIVALIVSEYCDGDADDQKQFAETLYLALHRILLSYVDFMKEEMKNG